MAPLVIAQGTTRTIQAAAIVDAAGAALDVTGWSVRAVIRQDTVRGAVVAEWVSGTPSGSQGQATASGSTVSLAITPSMSSAWTWSRGVLQAEITEPGGARVERIIDRPVILSAEAVT